jgi:hypothetical protein
MTNTVYSGITGISMLANMSYAGMRAQNNPDRTWRVLSFLFGLPWTIITLFAVKEGSMRAYGVELPGTARPAAETKPGL